MPAFGWYSPSRGGCVAGPLIHARIRIVNARQPRAETMAAGLGVIADVSDDEVRKGSPERGREDCVSAVKRVRKWTAVSAGPALIAIALALPQAAFAQSKQAFRLDPGEWRWVPFTIRRVPTEVDCRFEVLQGGPSVHVELLPMSEFRQFNRGRRHETLAVSPDSGSGEFRRIVEERGQYAVVIVNRKNAAAATVSLEVGTDLNPSASGIARELPAGRRLTVILISFAWFFATVTWSGIKLMRAVSGSRQKR
jgi:hypothetical protein